MTHRLSNTFGKKKVTIEQREKLVRSIFNRVAGRYDLMNDLMSMGTHRLWKRRFSKEARSASTGNICVDLAGGTGDIAQAIQNGDREVIIVDPSIEMMRIAQKRLGNHCHYLAATAENIPLPDKSVDLLTISFGIRNTTDISKSINEIFRVLKPGGHFYCLEFSTAAPWLRPFYDAWSRIVIPRLGAIIAGHPEAYTYLVESIREFPAQQEMVEMISDIGFKDVSFTNLSFGIACIHRAIKPE